jgi:hypothetical protein
VKILLKWRLPQLVTINIFVFFLSTAVHECLASRVSVVWHVRTVGAGRQRQQRVSGQTGVEGRRHAGARARARGARRAERARPADTGQRMVTNTNSFWFRLPPTYAPISFAHGFPISSLYCDASFGVAPTMTLLSGHLE